MSKYLGIALATAALIGAGAAMFHNNLGAAQATQSQTKPAAGQAKKGGPVWTPDGKMKLPTGYREWVFIGSPLTPNALNNGKAAFPEFHNVYVERSNFDAYMKTGTFPEGTVLVKELVLLQKPTFPDGSQTEPSGRGFFDRRVIATRSCFGLSRTESATPECRLSAKLKRQTTFGIW